MRLQRLQRFFKKFDLDYSLIAQAVVKLMEIPQPWVLSIDRTEWSFGSTRFNIFMLGVVHQGVAYPHELPLEGAASAAWLLRRLRLDDATEERQL